MTPSIRVINGLTVVTLSNQELEVDVAPEIGGRVISIRHRAAGELLWNRQFTPRALPPGSEYDSSFWGGIDELIPNDMPEPARLIGQSTGYEAGLHDHGELWTASLSFDVGADSVELSTRLPGCGLHYSRVMRLNGSRLVSEYRITNATTRPRQFLWKLHAALAVAEGDILDIPARGSMVADPDYSSFPADARWNPAAATVPPESSGTTDFWYLWDLSEGRATLRRRILTIGYEFDPAVFPCVWIFASWGGFESSYTAVFEPCTSMPISLADAAEHGMISRLEPGEHLETTVALVVDEMEDA